MTSDEGGLGNLLDDRRRGEPCERFLDVGDDGVVDRTRLHAFDDAFERVTARNRHDADGDFRRRACVLDAQNVRIGNALPPASRDDFVGIGVVVVDAHDLLARHVVELEGSDITLLARDIGLRSTRERLDFSVEVEFNLEVDVLRTTLVVREIPHVDCVLAFRRRTLGPADVLHGRTGLRAASIAIDVELTTSAVVLGVVVDVLAPGRHDVKVEIVEGVPDKRGTNTAVLEPSAGVLEALANFGVDVRHPLFHRLGREDEIGVELALQFGEDFARGNVLADIVADDALHLGGFHRRVHRLVTREEAESLLTAHIDGVDFGLPGEHVGDEFRGFFSGSPATFFKPQTSEVAVHPLVGLELSDLKRSPVRGRVAEGDEHQLRVNGGARKKQGAEEGHQAGVDDFGVVPPRPRHVHREDDGRHIRHGVRVETFPHHPFRVEVVMHPAGATLRGLLAVVKGVFVRTRGSRRTDGVFVARDSR